MVTSSFQLEQSKDGVTFAWTERTVEEEQDGAASWENVGSRCLLDTRVKKSVEQRTPREDARRQDGTSLANQ